MWLDRVDPEEMNEHETVMSNEILNGLFEMNVSDEDKILLLNMISCRGFYENNCSENILKMRQVRYKNFNEYACFDQEDDVIDEVIKGWDVGPGFKKYTKGQKMLKVDGMMNANSAVTEGDEDILGI